MTQPPGKHLSKLHDLLRENAWTEDTRLFRGTLTEFLTRLPGEKGAAGPVRLSANANPPEAVIDIYGQGHNCLAREVGAGLAFVESAEHEWRGAGRTCVSVRLGDVISQGGRIYPVTSAATQRTWYLTLPSGGVTVKKA